MSAAEELARLCAEARSELHLAGRTLHDEVGPLLSIAGLLLEQLRDDHPASSEQAKEVLERLNDAMEHVRRVSQRVNPTPSIRTGLQRALTELAERTPGMALTFSNTAQAVPGPVWAALFEATSVMVADAVARKATRVVVDVRGSAGVQVRISDNGKVRRTGLAPLEATCLLAQQLGIRVTSESGKTTRHLAGQATIVSVQYASRRSTGGRP